MVEEVSIREVLRFLEKRAPKKTAEKWDNVGLNVGSRAWKTRSAIIATDLTDEAIALAVKKKANLIVTHHPCLFPKGQRVTKSKRLAALALRKKIAVISVHTNFDRSALEVVHLASGALGVRPLGRLKGYGFWGSFGRTISFRNMIRRVNKVFKTQAVIVTGAGLQKKIKRVGFVAGKGSAFLNHAHQVKCDVFLTGETGFHPAREAASRGLMILEIGHTQSEKFFLSVMSDWLITLVQKVYVVSKQIQTFERSS